MACVFECAHHRFHASVREGQAVESLENVVVFRGDRVDGISTRLVLEEWERTAVIGVERRVIVAG